MKKFCPCLLALLIGCGTSVSPDPSTSIPGPPGEPGPNVPVEPEACTKMDIVFVVDDSGSMAEEQSNLIANFPQFFNVIDGYRNQDGAPLDYRIAVTTTGRDIDYTISVDPGSIPIPIPGFPGIPEFPDTISEHGDNGAFRMTDGMTRPWLQTGDANIAQTFSSLANVGTGGPSIEMPLYTLQLALSDRMNDGTNTGFLRSDALLAVVILTDEDDCSRADNNFVVESDQDCSGDTAIPTAQSVAFLDQVTGGHGRWASATIAGPQACSSSFGNASAATRLMEFTNQVGTNGIFSSICEGDLTGALTDALNTFDAACNALPPLE